MSTHPVMVALAFAGPASVNSHGRARMEQKGVAVGADGAIAVNGPTLAAFDALRAEQTLEDRNGRRAMRCGTPPASDSPRTMTKAADGRPGWTARKASPS